MFYYRTLVLSTFASLAFGCAIGPDYKKPEMPLPEHYRSKIQIEKRVAAEKVEIERWWEGFNDPMLSRFITLAFDQNLDLAQASARIAQAKSGVRMTNAALLPSGNLSANATKNHMSLETPLGQLLNASPGFDRNDSLYEANLSASWEMDVFGGLQRDQQAAAAEYQASEASKVATRLAVAAQTADLYITIRNLQSRINIAKQQVETQQKLLSIVSLLYNKGLAPQLQVQQTEGALSQVKATIPALEAGLEAALNSLDVMLGVAPGTYRAELAPVQNIPSPPQISSMGTPSDLLRRRPDLIVAERYLAASNARIGAAMAEYYPKFSISALLGTATAISTGNLFSSGASQAAGILGLRWRLFDFKRIDAQIDSARGSESEALARYRQAVLRATADVENAFTSLVKSEEQATTLSEGETSLRNARDSALTAYKNGLLSLIEVLHADENLLKISDAKVQAKAQSAQAAVATFKALGGGWDGSKLEYQPATTSVEPATSLASGT
ncbi:efflux transporter outer membrane subunit [Methylotenera sp.]|uniref:efflux transporter outer membrane subunit n=1 Tax=Methylotenera sp. TaxID=2051956 RepID=UPI00273584A9|nr:TolC family protein [Methylotenera sp.]MDP3308618.1 TolC family protein [Methylotenera sp.]